MKPNLPVNRMLISRKKVMGVTISVPIVEALRLMNAAGIAATRPKTPAIAAVCGIGGHFSGTIDDARRATTPIASPNTMEYFDCGSAARRILISGVVLSWAFIFR